MSTAEAHLSMTQQYEHQRQAFRVHAGVFAVSMVIIFITNLAINSAADLTGELSAWWSGWALIGWGIGVSVHGLVVRLARPDSSSQA